MGAAFCKKSPPARIMMQGLDAAGKTTLLYKLKLGEVVTTIPTIGFNVEEVAVNNLTLHCWDIGGRDKIRPLLRHYMNGCSAVILVVDANDRERLDEALETFVKDTLKAFPDETSEVPVLVMVNKQDIQGAVSCDEVRQKFMKKYLTEVRNLVMFHPCSAVTGDGLFEAFDELTKVIKGQRADQDKKELAEAGGKYKLTMSNLMHQPAGFIKSLLSY